MPPPQRPTPLCCVSLHPHPRGPTNQTPHPRIGRTRAIMGASSWLSAEADTRKGDEPEAEAVVRTNDSAVAVEP